MPTVEREFHVVELSSCCRRVVTESCSRRVVAEYDRSGRHALHLGKQKDLRQNVYEKCMTAGRTETETEKETETMTETETEQGR